ncbi:hypothetical protein D3C86_1715310 [compost metagenome]
MPGEHLGGAAGHAVAKQAVDRLALHGVIEPGGGAVQVDVPHLLRRQASLGQRHLHGCLGADTVWMGRRDVPGIGRLPRSQQRQRRRRAAQQKQRGALADIDPLARLIKRLATRTAEGLQAVKTIEG